VVGHAARSRKPRASGAPWGRRPVAGHELLQSDPPDHVQLLEGLVIDRQLGPEQWPTGDTGPHQRTVDPAGEHVGQTGDLEGREPLVQIPPAEVFLTQARLDAPLTHADTGLRQEPPHLVG